MYYPYFRGKQYELITIRENAETLARSGFVPIIEPVKRDLAGLVRSLNAVREQNGNVIVVVNPRHGDHAENGDGISDLLHVDYRGVPGISAGYLLMDDTPRQAVVQFLAEHSDFSPALIHAGFREGAELANELGAQAVRALRHIFLDEHAGRLYRRHFRSNERALVRDGFVKRRNRDHPRVEFFSDLHLTYDEEGMQGFGDYLTVGDDFSEGGGPAYAIAIHLTFIDPRQESAMYVYHFVSERQDSPSDPAGKFAEALRAMIAELDRPDSPVYETQAVAEFRALHAAGHYPGLGYVKKLSMQHHIETLAQFYAG
jgi:hypothetical protein